MMSIINENIKDILDEIPKDVKLVVAAKTRSVKELSEAIEAGIKIIGQNYVQEAEKTRQELGNKVKWHLIGHLQRNKVKKAVKIFDMIQTVDSVKVAEEIDKQCKKINKKISILIEINSAREKQKSGVFPEKAVELIKHISKFQNLRILGVMTMGFRSENPENLRPYFIETKKIFEYAKKINLNNIEMKYLSMGMTNSYKIAIQEGANMIRVGTKIFGKNKKF